MTSIRSLGQMSLDNLPWHKARIKFIARYLMALFITRTIKLSAIATSFLGRANEEYNYKTLLRGVRSSPYATRPIRR
jgi:hypothetical protein